MYCYRYYWYCECWSTIFLTGTLVCTLVLNFLKYFWFVLLYVKTGLRPEKKNQRLLCSFWKGATSPLAKATRTLIKLPMLRAVKGSRPLSQGVTPSIKTNKTELWQCDGSQWLALTGGAPDGIYGPAESYRTEGTVNGVRGKQVFLLLPEVSNPDIYLLPPLLLHQLSPKSQPFVFFSSESSSFLEATVTLNEVPSSSISTTSSQHTPESPQLSLSCWGRQTLLSWN